MKKTALALIFILCFSFIAEAGTRSALRDKVRSLMNEPSGNSNYSDTDINDALNFGIDYLSNNLADSYQHRAITKITGTLTTDNFISVPADFRKVIAVKIYSKQATFLKMDQFFNKENYISTTDPHYAVYGDKIYFYPAGNMTYEVFYMKRPALMSIDSDTTPIIWNSEIDRPLTLIAAAYMLNCDNQTNKAKGFESMAEKYISAVNGSYINTTPEPLKAGEKSK